MRYLFTLFLFVISLYSSSLELVLKDDISSYKNFEILYLKDSSNSMGTEQVANSKDFIKHSNKFSLGYLPNTIWIKIDLKNKRSKEDYIL